jgi:hypothetical protein
MLSQTLTLLLFLAEIDQTQDYQAMAALEQHQHTQLIWLLEEKPRAHQKTKKFMLIQTLF